MAKHKKFSPKDLKIQEDLGEDIPMHVLSPTKYKESLVYVRLEKHAKAYKFLFVEQFKNGLVKTLGNIRVGEFEFELGKTYEVPKTPEIESAMRSRLLMSSGSFHYIGNKPEVDIV